MNRLASQKKKNRSNWGRTNSMVKQLNTDEESAGVHVGYMEGWESRTEIWQPK